jgi:hypothetical protein
MCFRKQQYERKISQRHLDKNVKDSEMQYMAEKAEEAENCSKTRTPPFA